MSGNEKPERSDRVYQTHADQREPKPSADRPAKNELLARVLGETLARQGDDPALMLQSLRRWRSTIPSPSFDQPVCRQLVSQVLDFRLGDIAKELPEQLQRDVGDVLWNDPDSRLRMENIWNSIADQRADDSR